jgi:predicted O-methyltransferase YrrM
MLACLNGSKSIIECGTSFGVSTIYMALAVSQNASRQNREAYGVLTMEKDSSKVARAKKIWAEAGPDVEEWIHPHEGDLLEILQNEDLLPKTVDLLFLDGNVMST